jgi:hypothetical protein
MSIKLLVYLYLAVSIIFEMCGDYCVKIASISVGSKSKFMWIVSLVAYNFMLIAWMIAVKYAKVITIPGTV